MRTPCVCYPTSEYKQVSFHQSTSTASTAVIKETTERKLICRDPLGQKKPDSLFGTFLDEIHNSLLLDDFLQPLARLAYFFLPYLSSLSHHRLPHTERSYCSALGALTLRVKADCCKVHGYNVKV